MSISAIRLPLTALALAGIALFTTNFARAAATTAAVGQTVTFSVTADGTTPFTYQWRKNAANITAATAATYVISSAQLTDAATYCVVVSNSAGSTTSDNAILTVNPAAVAPAFTLQPVSQTVTAGSPVTFTAAASGSPAPTYQWKKNGTTITGATSASYTIASVVAGNAGTYTVVATNSVGSATSNGAVLTVNTPLAVSTLAGYPLSSGSSNGIGSTARFYYPTGIVADNAGNLYIADTDNNTIRKVVAATGEVTTLAGLAGSSGSTDGNGTTARFNHPSGVAVDSAGNVYVADTLNHTLRKITPLNTVSTIAGSAGNGGSTDGTAGSTARFQGPQGLAIDTSSNLYVADTNNHTIRKVVLSTKIVTTVAGLAGNSGSADGIRSLARFNYPSDVAVDEDGDLFVADTENHTVRMILPSGLVSTLAGLAGAKGGADGTGSAARFNSPSAVAVDLSDNVYVADTDNDTIRMVVPSSCVVSTLAGLAGTSGSTDGLGSAVRFYSPAGITVDSSSNLYVADTNNHTIRVGLLPSMPAIQRQPQSQSVTVGNSVQFSVTASGRPAVSYQWYFNGTAITGATNSVYSLLSAQSGNAGNYTVVVSNVMGSVTSNQATLTVHSGIGQ